MTAPEHTWMTIDGYFVDKPNDAVCRVAYTRTDICIRRDDPALRQAMEALMDARGFISNGVEFGYISMPDKDTPDEAHNTLPRVTDALAAMQELIGVKDGQA